MTNSRYSPSSSWWRAAAGLASVAVLAEVFTVAQAPQTHAATTVVNVATYDEFVEAIQDANGDYVINITADLVETEVEPPRGAIYADSITINGDGHTITVEYRALNSLYVGDFAMTDLTITQVPLPEGDEPYWHLATA